MDKISQRQKNIIDFLIRLKNCTCKDIAQHLDLSDKTIRNEIKTINHISKTPIILSGNKGFSINPNYTNFIGNLLQEDNIEINPKNQLLHQLLLNKTTLNFEETADFFCMSPSSLQNQIKQINVDIKEYNLKIIRENTKLIIQGNDYNRRKLFISLIHEEIDTNFHDINNCIIFFPNIDIVYTKQVIVSAIEEFGYTILDFYMTNFLINIFTILSIEPSHSFVFSDDQEKYSNEVLIAKKIVEELNIEDGNFLVAKIAESLVGIIRPLATTTNIKQEIKLSNSFVKKVRTITANAFKNFSIDTNLDDFIALFLNHIDAMIQRQKNNNTLSIAPLVSLKNSCFFVYDVAVYICKELNHEFDIVIPETEISLVAIHIGFAIESSFKDDKVINIALLTDNYYLINTYISKNILADLQQHIRIKTVDSISELHALNDVDLLITTKLIQNHNILEICQISPLLTNIDKAEIQKSILNVLSIKSNNSFIRLAKRFFDEKLFFYTSSIDTKEQALHFLNEQLLLNNFVENSFLDSVIKREALSSTAFLNEFAIPHAFDNIALKTKIAVLINPNKIKWTKQDSVQFVFLIAISEGDQKSLKLLYDGFSNILSNDQKLLELKKINDFENFINRICILSDIKA